MPVVVENCLYVIDTNILLHNPAAIDGFEDHQIVVPIHVVMELDAHKKRMDAVGASARRASRLLDELLMVGGEGCRVSTYIPKGQMDSNALTKRDMDSWIILAALELHNSSSNRVVLVSRDVNVRIRARALGIRSEDYRASKVNVEEIFTGLTYTTEKFEHPTEVQVEDSYPNQFYHVTNSDTGKPVLLRMVDGQLQLAADRRAVKGIRPRNMGQQMAMELLMDPGVQFVTIFGLAGGGKSLMALAAGLAQQAEQTYQKIVVARPVTPMGGQDIGFLPGGMAEKLAPWMAPIQDNLEYIFRDRQFIDGPMVELLESGKMEVQSLGHIRGRSMPRTFLIVDEAQSLSLLEAKTILTRAGEGTKVVFLGDIEQIDNPHVCPLSNGMTLSMYALLDSDLSGTITLTQSERSKLAEAAATSL